MGFLSSTEGSLLRKTVRSGIWVGLSKAGLNSMAIVRTVILARLLTPEIFGLMGICAIVTRFLDVFSRPGVAAALVHRKRSFEEAKDTAYTILVARGFVVALAAFLVAPLVAGYYEKEVLNPVVRLISVTFILGGFRNINTVALQKNLDFKRLAFIDQAASILHTVVVVVLAYYLRSVWALVYGQIVASLAAMAMSFLIVRGRPRLRFNKAIARELFTYGKFITGSSAVIFVATEMDNVVAGKVLGMEMLGYYVLAFSLANLPATQISKVISDVLFPAYSKLQDNLDKLRDAYLIVLKYVSLLTIPAAAGMIALGPEIIRVVYGEKWMPALAALPILCVFGGIRSISALNGYLFNGIGKPGIPFYTTLVRLCLIALIIWPLTREYQLAGTAIAVTLPLAVELVLGFFFMIRSLGLRPFQVLGILSLSVGSSLLMALVVWFAKGLFETVDLVALLLLVVIGIFAYVMIHFRELLGLYRERGSLRSRASKT